MEGTMLLLCSGAGDVPVHFGKQNLGSATCSQTSGENSKANRGREWDIPSQGLAVGVSTVQGAVGEEGLRLQDLSPHWPCTPGLSAGRGEPEKITASFRIVVVSTKIRAEPCLTEPLCSLGK